jgi:hypothetical protein
MPKPATNPLQPYQRWTVQIYGTKESSDFRGTGFLLNANHVVTCKHVLHDRGGKWVKTGESSTAISFDVSAQLDALDIAVVKLETSLNIESFATMVEGVDEQVIKDLLNGNCMCYGHNPLEPYKYGAYMSGTNNTSFHLQFEGAPLEGFSGSPLLLSEFPCYGVFGMAWLGGKDAGNSRIIRSDAIIEWLRSLNKPELLPQTVSIDEVLRRIAFGDRDWSSVVRNQWLSMWGYARNENGAYVGSDGKTPLKDNRGRPIVVFNEETERFVRDQGLNTGSIEYASLYDAAPDRFGASETDEEIVQEARERMGIED